MTEGSKKKPEYELKLEEQISLYQERTVPAYLYGGYTGPSPVPVLENPPKPHNWFWRNHWKVGGLMVLGSLAWGLVPIFSEFGQTELFSRLFLWVAVPIEFVGASLLFLRFAFSPPRERAWKKIEPFAKSLDGLLEVATPYILECSKAGAEALARTNLVETCERILEFQDETKREPPSVEKDERLALLRRELAKAYDTFQEFGLASGGYGPYYEEANRHTSG